MRLSRGAPWLAKGRYHCELPWPKRDLSVSATLYEKAIAKFPAEGRRVQEWAKKVEAKIAEELE